MTEEILECFLETPIVAAIKDEDGLMACIDSPCSVVFVLYGDICSIGQIVSRLKNAEKIVMVHCDLIEGLENKPIGAKFIKEYTNADGIISTKPNILKTAKELGLVTVMRFFAIDSLSVENVKKHAKSCQSNFVEVLPAVATKIISRLSVSLDIPIIAGGLIMEKEDVFSALQAGAVAISTTDKDVWKM